MLLFFAAGASCVLLLLILVFEAVWSVSDLLQFLSIFSLFLRLAGSANFAVSSDLRDFSLDLADSCSGLLDCCFSADFVDLLLDL